MMGILTPQLVLSVLKGYTKAAMFENLKPRTPINPILN